MFFLWKTQKSCLEMRDPFAPLKPTKSTSGLPGMETASTNKQLVSPTVTLNCGIAVVKTIAVIREDAESQVSCRSGHTPLSYNNLLWSRDWSIQSCDHPLQSGGIWLQEGPAEAKWESGQAWSQRPPFTNLDWGTRVSSSVPGPPDQEHDCSAAERREGGLWQSFFLSRAAQKTTEVSSCSLLSSPDGWHCSVKAT